MTQQMACVKESFPWPDLVAPLRFLECVALLRSETHASILSWAHGLSALNWTKTSDKDKETGPHIPEPAIPRYTKQLHWKPSNWSTWQSIEVFFGVERAAFLRNCHTVWTMGFVLKMLKRIHSTHVSSTLDIVHYVLHVCHSTFLNCTAFCVNQLWSQECEHDSYSNGS